MMIPCVPIPLNPYLPRNSLMREPSTDAFYASHVRACVFATQRPLHSMRRIMHSAVVKASEGSQTFCIMLDITRSFCITTCCWTGSEEALHDAKLSFMCNYNQLSSNTATSQGGTRPRQDIISIAEGVLMSVGDSLSSPFGCLCLAWC
jgi:hypothetical protein